MSSQFCAQCSAAGVQDAHGHHVNNAEDCQLCVAEAEPTGKTRFQASYAAPQQGHQKSGLQQP